MASSIYKYTNQRQKNKKREITHILQYNNIKLTLCNVSISVFLFSSLLVIHCWLLYMYYMPLWYPGLHGKEPRGSEKVMFAWCPLSSVARLGSIHLQTRQALGWPGVHLHFESINFLCTVFNWVAHECTSLISDWVPGISLYQ